MAKARPGQTTVSDGVDIRDAILSGAYECFAQYGVRKTTVEDIASAAAVSRPTVYKHFSSKDAIVNEICLLETAKLNDEVRSRRTHGQSAEKAFTDCIMLSVRIAHDNEFIRRLLDQDVLPSAIRQSASHNPIHKLQIERWSHLLQAQSVREGISPDLNLDDLAIWLTFCQTVLLLRLDAGDISDDELSRFVRRFVVRPILKG